MISVVIPARDALAHYRDCLTSLLGQDPAPEVIWVDSASTDGSSARVKAEFPDVRVIDLEYNAGYRGGANLGAGEARGAMIVIANQDVRFEAGFLRAIREVADRHPEAAIIAPKILDFDQPHLVNEAGNTLHCSGLYGSRGLGAPASEYSAEARLAAMSGCCFVIRRESWIAAGGFSRDFDLFDTGWHASYEDADLAWRVRLAGGEILYAPDAVMAHKFQRKPMSAERFRSYEWGRWMTLARNYRLSTLFLLAPVLIAVEAGVLLFAGFQGLLGPKAGAVRWMLTHIPAVLERRRRVQGSRQVSDGVILREMSATIDVSHQVRGLPARTLVLLFDLLSRLNYAVARAVVR